MTSNSKVFKIFQEWEIIEQYVREFIMLVDYDGVKHYLPSNDLYQEHFEKDEDYYIMVETYHYDTVSGFTCEGHFYGHPITKESEQRVRHQNDIISFILDMDSLKVYSKKEPSIQRHINRCKLTQGNMPDFNVHGSLLDVIDITEFELLRQYTNNTYSNDNYIIADKVLIETLKNINIDNKALMFLINVMYKSLQ